MKHINYVHNPSDRQMFVIFFLARIKRKLPLQNLSRLFLLLSLAVMALLFSSSVSAATCPTTPIQTPPMAIASTPYELKDFGYDDDENTGESSLTPPHYLMTTHLDINANGLIGVTGNNFVRYRSTDSQNLMVHNPDLTVNSDFPLQPKNTQGFDPANKDIVALDDNSFVLWNDWDGRLDRINSDGSRAQFAPGFSTTTVMDLLESELGDYILVMHHDGSYRITKISGDGNTVEALYSSSTGGGEFTIYEQPDGKILVGAQNRAFTRLNADGTEDNGFTKTTINLVSDIAMQSDGKIIIAGGVANGNGMGLTADGKSYFGLVRLNTDGTIDSTFDEQVYSSTSQNDQNTGGYTRLVEVNSADEIYVSGHKVARRNGMAIPNIFKLNADGTQNEAFSRNVFFVAGSVTDMQLQCDGKLVLLNQKGINNVFHQGITRLLPNGRLDTSYNATNPTPSDQDGVNILTEGAYRVLTTYPDDEKTSFAEPGYQPATTHPIDDTQCKRDQTYQDRYGDYLAVGHEAACGLKVIDLTTGAVVWEFFGDSNDGNYTHLDIDPTGSVLMATAASEVQQYELDTGNLIRTFSYAAFNRSTTYSPESGQYLFSLHGANTSDVMTRSDVDGSNLVNISLDGLSSSADQHDIYFYSDTDFYIVRKRANGIGWYIYKLQLVDGSDNPDPDGTQSKLDENFGTGGILSYLDPEVGGITERDIIRVPWDASGQVTVSPDGHLYAIGDDGTSDANDTEYSITRIGPIGYDIEPRYIPIINTSGSTNLISWGSGKAENDVSLIKSFADADVEVGKTTTLTFTISGNGEDIAGKTVSFTDTFQADMVVADTPNVINNCEGQPQLISNRSVSVNQRSLPNASITAVAGSNNIVVDGLVLNAGITSCTISVDVTSQTSGTYTNGANNISSMSGIGIDTMTDQLVTFRPIDTDNDGVPDNTDVDSDGDGLLDADECADPRNLLPPAVSGLDSIIPSHNPVQGETYGWNFEASGSCSVNNQTGAASPIVSPQGGAYVSCTLNEGFSRNITGLIPGETYTVGFWTEIVVAKDPPGSHTNSGNYFININGLQHEIQTFDNTNYDWYWREYTFVAASDVHSLYIQANSIDTVDIGVVFDGFVLSRGTTASLADSNVNSCSVDTDGDGVYDYLDLDSDNDGLPDNVEAQSTSGYIAPTGTDTDNDGLDDAYDTDNGGTAITSVDTDGSSSDGDGSQMLPDYRDTDSDNDGSDDSAESGLTLSGTDANADGIDDGINASYSDPNGDVNDPATDLTDTDAGYDNENEPDVRDPNTDDPPMDTDGDGIDDSIDKDSDGDGIPDVVEGCDGSVGTVFSSSDSGGVLAALSLDPTDLFEPTTDYTPTNPGADSTVAYYYIDGKDYLFHTGSRGLEIFTMNSSTGAIALEETINTNGFHAGANPANVHHKVLNGVTYMYIENRHFVDVYKYDAVLRSWELLQEFGYSDLNATGSNIGYAGPAAIHTADDGTTYVYVSTNYQGQSGSQINRFTILDNTGLPDLASQEQLTSVSDGFGIINNMSIVDTDAGAKMLTENGSDAVRVWDIDANGSVTGNYRQISLSTSGSAFDAKNAMTNPPFVDANNNIIFAGGHDSGNAADNGSIVVYDPSTDTILTQFSNGNMVGRSHYTTDDDGYIYITTTSFSGGGANTHPYTIILNPEDYSVEAHGRDADGGFTSFLVQSGSILYGPQSNLIVTTSAGQSFLVQANGGGDNDGFITAAASALKATNYINGSDDQDGDGISNCRDLDSDNDGIPDNVEAQSTANYTAPTGNDTDNDGLDDAYDTDNGGTAITPVDTDGSATDGDGSQTLPDFLDTDSDGDGTNDSAESGLILSGTDANADGIDDGINASYSDPNGDVNDPATDLTDTDAGYDNENEPDVRDPNTDDPPMDTDGDGIDDSIDPDSDGDGITDIVEGSLDSDGDGIPDRLDLDSDNDGIPDNVEAQSTANYIAPTGNDTDNDGLDDAYDTDNGGTAITPVDTDGSSSDGDGSQTLPDYLDTDSDNDGATDAVESGNIDAGETYADPNGSLNNGASGLPDSDSAYDANGEPDFRDAVDDVPPDTDGDGLSDELEGTLGTNPNNPDTDGDGLSDGVEHNTTGSDPNDVDTDGDGIHDNHEVGNDVNNLPDTDNDGTADVLDTDDDGDGVLTQYEAPDANSDGDPTDAQDTDNNGTPDYLDTDDDGDGKLTSAENADANSDGNPVDANDMDADGIPDYLDADEVPTVLLQVRAILQGAYDSGTGLMRDDLRSKLLIPEDQPYSDATTSFDHAGSETLSVSLMNTTGDDAPVDWVLIELRGADRATRVASIAAVLQRDGDVMDAQTGSTNLRFPNVTVGNYYVTVNHRNHLGVVTENMVSLSAVSTLVDFTLPATAVHGEHARIEDQSISMLWAGEANRSNSVVANGPGNDINILFGQVLSSPGNSTLNGNYRLQGYEQTDFNLDGLTVFAGPDNDANLVVGNVLLHPGNETFSANFIVPGKLPGLDTVQ